MAAFGAGVGPCGHDPEDELDAGATQTPVGALYFDPYDRVYAQNADHTMVQGAGPIQRAAHLLLPLGGIPAVASSGFDVASVKRSPPSQRQLALEDALRRAWKTLLESGQIEMGKVTMLDVDGSEWTAEKGRPWGGRFDVVVRDLVTKQPATLEAKVT